MNNTNLENNDLNETMEENNSTYMDGLDEEQSYEEMQPYESFDSSHISSYNKSVQQKEQLQNSIRKANKNQNAAQRLRQRNANTLGKKVESSHSTSSNNDDNNQENNQQDDKSSNEKLTDKLNPANKLKNFGNNAKNAVKQKTKEAGKAVAKGIASGIKILATNPATAPAFWTIMGALILVIMVPVFISVFNGDSNGSNGGSSGGSSELICKYTVGGNEYSDIKVQLMECDTSSFTPIAGEELVDFEKYVLGVAYIENFSNESATKAQIIAARSYALTRRAIVEENGQKILQMRNCTSDQVYCDPDKGCWSNSASAGATVHSGVDNSKAFHRGPMAADHEARKWADEVSGIVVQDSSGNVVNTPYCSDYGVCKFCNRGSCMSQNEATRLGASGSDYNQILMHAYGQTASGINAEKTCKSSQGGNSSIASADFIWPADGNVVTSLFGYRGYVPGGTSYHDAIDIGAPVGSNEYSIADGKVLYAGGSYHTIVIYHGIMNGNKIFSRYMHGDMKVSTGDVVKKGQVVATAAGWGPNGSSSYGSHLDFAVIAIPEDVDESQYNSYRRINPLMKIYGLNYDGKADQVMNTSILKFDGTELSSLSFNDTEYKYFIANWCQNNSGPCGRDDVTLSQSDFNG